MIPSFKHVDNIAINGCPAACRKQPPNVPFRRDLFPQYCCASPICPQTTWQSCPYPGSNIWERSLLQNSLFPQICSQVSPPSALLQPCPVVPVLRVIRILCQLLAGKIRTLPAVCMLFGLTAALQRAALTPEGLFYIHAALTAHALPESALTAQNSTSRFDHIPVPHFPAPSGACPIFEVIRINSIITPPLLRIPLYSIKPDN